MFCRHISRKSHSSLIYSTHHVHCVHILTGSSSYCLVYHMRQINEKNQTADSNIYSTEDASRTIRLRQSSKPNFGVVWPWTLTFWPPKLTASRPCPVYHLCQFAAKSVHSFSDYLVHKFDTGRTNGRTDGQMNERTDGRPGRKHYVSFSLDRQSLRHKNRWAWENREAVVECHETRLWRESVESQALLCLNEAIDDVCVIWTTTACLKKVCPLMFDKCGPIFTILSPISPIDS